MLGAKKKGGYVRKAKGDWVADAVAGYNKASLALKEADFICRRLDLAWKMTFSDKDGTWSLNRTKYEAFFEALSTLAEARRVEAQAELDRMSEVLAGGERSGT